MILQEKRQNTNGWITQNVNWCSGYWSRCRMSRSQGTSWTEESGIFKTSDFHLWKICRSDIFTALGVTVLSDKIPSATDGVQEPRHWTTHIYLKTPITTTIRWSSTMTTMRASLTSTTTRIPSPIPIPWPTSKWALEPTPSHLNRSIWQAKDFNHSHRHQKYLTHTCLMLCDIVFVIFLRWEFDFNASTIIIKCMELFYQLSPHQVSIPWARPVNWELVYKLVCAFCPWWGGPPTSFLPAQPLWPSCWPSWQLSCQATRQNQQKKFKINFIWKLWHLLTTKESPTLFFGIVSFDINDHQPDG